MFGTHVVTGDEDGLRHRFEVGTCVQLFEDDGTTRKCWVDEHGNSSWVHDGDLEAIHDPS